MTTPRGTQFGNISVAQSTATPLVATQFGIISVQQDAPTISPALASQFGAIIVVANNIRVQTLGPVIGLGCWSPCATLAHRFGVVPTNQPIGEEN